MELADYDIAFVHMKGRNNILAVVIFRLKNIRYIKGPNRSSKNVKH